MAAMGTTVMAAPDTVTIQKDLTKDANTYTPDATYTFTITPADGETDGSVYEGIAGGVTSSVEIPTENPNEGIGSEKVTVGTGTISVVPETFTHPGVYHYTVTENDTTYEGITKDETSKDLYVYITVNEETGELVYEGCTFGREDAAGKDTGIFTNDYANGTNDLTVTKNVTGNQGDRNKAFTFTAKVTGQDGEKYYVTFSDGTAAQTITSGGSLEFKLSNDESATIHGLSANDTYEIVEKDANSDGYTTTVEGNDKGTISADTTVTYTNDKKATTPTGIVTDVAPYVIMVAAAVILGFAFLRKRSYK